MDKLRKLKEQLLRRFAAGGRPAEPTLSTGIDFYSIEMKDLFPSYTEMLSAIKNKVQGLKDALISGSSSLDDVSAFIDAQLAELESIVAMIVSFLDSFVVDLSGTGTYYQNFDKATNTAETIKAGMQADHPSTWANEKYAIVLGFFASDSGITKLAELIGLS